MRFHIFPWAAPKLSVYLLIFIYAVSACHFNCLFFSVNPEDTTFPPNLLPPVPLVSTRTKEVHRSIEHLKI